MVALLLAEFEFTALWHHSFARVLNRTKNLKDSMTPVGAKNPQRGAPGHSTAQRPSSNPFIASTMPVKHCERGNRHLVCSVAATSTWKIRSDFQITTKLLWFHFSDFQHPQRQKDRSLFSSLVCDKRKKSRYSSDRSTDALKSFYTYFGIRDESCSHSGKIWIGCQNLSCNIIHRWTKKRCFSSYLYSLSPFFLRRGNSVRARL